MFGVVPALDILVEHFLTWGPEASHGGAKKFRVAQRGVKATAIMGRSAQELLSLLRGQFFEEGAVRILESNAQCVIIDRGEDRFFANMDQDLRGPDIKGRISDLVFPVVNDVFRSEGMTIGPAHTFSQMKDKLPILVADLPTLGQVRYYGVTVW